MTDREAIIAAIKAIPTSKSAQEIDANLPSQIHALMVTGGDARKPLLPTPRAIQTGLEKVQQAANALQIALDELAPEAAAIFRDVGALKTTVRTVSIIAAAGASDNVSQFADTEGPKLPFVRPTVMLALDAAYIFAMVSGARPTLRARESKKYGPYLDFVTAIFKARRITASPENCAKKAIKMLTDMAK